MSVFILTWNPDRWHWDEVDYQKEVRTTSRGRRTRGGWSTGGRIGGVSPGDRAFLLRQHRDRGVVASGDFTSQIYQDAHWDGSGRLANFADISFDVVLPVTDRLPIGVLHARLSSVSWDRMQGSGVRLPDDVGDELEEIWREHLGKP
jgi:5-methylcytosine-specific restriction enzyme A